MDRKTIKELATQEQPTPVPGDGVSCHDRAVEAVLRAGTTDDLDLALVEALRARQELGVQRYGTTLQRGNGRDALVDAIQEGLDMIAYLAQAGLEDSDAFRVAHGLMVMLIEQVE